jgi:Ca-activated chloride channel family protein
MRTRGLVAACVALLVTAGCNVNTGDGNGTDASGNGCTNVALASSPEKLDLLTDLSKRFNEGGDNKVDGKCSFVQVTKVSSGIGASLLSDGWTDEAQNGAKPVVWSPAASSWGAVVNERLAQKQQPAIVPSDAKPFMLTPLVIAMPKPMAEALGYPQTPIGFGDLLELAKANNGWASKGHPEWGAFKLGKTNPNFSTSGLSSTIAQYYAATGKQSDLTLEDVNRPDVDTFMRGVESSVVHYGDTTLSFLNNLYRNDRAGLGLTYVSAVAVEETSIIAYNRGNPDGILEPGEQPRPPRIPLVAVYPKDGTLFSDNPFFVLNAPWVTATQKKAARAFESFVQQPQNQRRVLGFGFRPGNPGVAVHDPISAKYGVDPTKPDTALGVPEPAVLVRLLEKWGEQR